MKTVELKKCLRIIGYEEHNDESVILELLSSDISPLKYCDPFKMELKNNLFQIKSRQNKIDAIKYYILELYSVCDFLRNNYELLFTGSLNTIFGPIEYTSKTGEKFQLNEFERYTVGCRTLYGILFGIIEDSCNTYNLAFQTLCDDLKVDLTHYNVSSFEKAKGLPKESINSIVLKGKEQLKIKHKNTDIREKPKTFEELFSNENEADSSIQILREVEPPVINQKGHYILGSRSKGSITAWVQAHKQKSKITTISDKDIAPLLNAAIPGLNIDERTLRNTGTTAYTKYFIQILALI